MIDNYKIIFYNSRMRIIVIRHGEKSGEGLSERWVRQSIQAGKNMAPIWTSTFVLSSSSQRVKDTLIGVLKGAACGDELKIKERHYLGINGAPPEFNEKYNQKISEGSNQNDVVWEFLRWEWTEAKPKDIAKKFIYRILGLMRKMSKSSSCDIPDFLLGTHQTNVESVILTLFDTAEIPDEWKTPIWFAESAEFEILMKEWLPSLTISYRGYEKVIMFNEIRELYQKNYSGE